MRGPASSDPPAAAAVSQDAPAVEAGDRFAASPRPDDAPRAIAARHLVKTYGRQSAVSDVSLDVARGEIFGLLGPNGAGKTTTVGMLTTRVRPTAGEALIAGVDVARDAVAVKRLIGVVPQINTLDRGLTVFETLYFHGLYFGMNGQAARYAAERELERFGLSTRAGDLVIELSGGMAQRLMLARAVVHQPRVLFLDEPTSALDPQGRLELWELLQRLKAEDMTILLTTHNIDEADRLCGRVAIMHRGRILVVDEPRRLKQRAGIEVRIGCGDAPEGLERVLRQEVPGLEGGLVEDGLLAFRTSDVSPVIGAIGRATASGITISSLDISEASLESVLLQLTGEAVHDGEAVHE